MKTLSLSVISKYRNNAKIDVDIPYDILKIRLNCLIDSVEDKHILKRGNIMIYQFGNCFLHTMNNMIVDISWKCADEKPTEYEIKKLRYLYKKHGLNRNGNKYRKKLF